MFHSKSLSMRQRLVAPLGLALALLSIPAGFAALVPADNFRTTPVMREETRNLLSYLEYSHYLRLKLNDIDANNLITEYLQTLDNKHLYFTEREVADARHRYATELTEQLGKGQLSTAFALFLDYRMRVMERNQWVLNRLKQPFDFNSDSTYEPDRSKAPWPLNTAEQTALWERQLKYELLNEMLPILVPYKDDEEDAKTAATAKDAPETKQTAETELVLEVRDQTTGEAVRRTISENEAVAAANESEPKTEAEALEEAVTTVKKRYERFVQWVEETEPEEVQEMFLSTLSRLYDPHSVFMSATTMEEFSMAIRNSLVGIGAVLSDMDGYCTIKELLPGGPAERSNRLKAEDQIVGVAQGPDGEMVDVIGMRLRKIVKMIRGAKGTEVRLLVRPANADPSERVTVTITRDEVKLTEQLAQAELYSLPAAEDQEALKIGVINLPAFYGASQGDATGANSTTSDVAELIGKLKKDGMQGLVLDLRSNGGGLLGEAISLTGLFLPKSPVVQVRNSRGQVQDFVAQNTDAVWDGPLVVLVSRFSASASEITAGALRDNRRALVIGDEATHGKGTVQAIFDMNRQNFFSMLRSNNRGAAKITVQKYYLPGGDSTQINGVQADIPLPSFNAFLPIGERDLPNALIHDSIEPVIWDRNTIRGADRIVSVNEGLIGKLLTASQQRQESLPEFSYLKRNIDFLRTKQEEKKLSLNLDGRLSQRQKDRLFRDTMEGEFNALRKNSYPFEKILLDTALKQKAEHNALMAERKSAAQQAKEAAATADATTASANDETKAAAGKTVAQAITAGSTTQKTIATTADSAAQAGSKGKDAPEATTAQETFAAGTNPDAGQNEPDILKTDAEATPDGEAVAELEESLPKVDIHLRESLRVMSDWIHFLRAPQGEQVAADTAATVKSSTEAPLAR